VPPTVPTQVVGAKLKPVSLNLIVSVLEPELFWLKLVKLRCGSVEEPSVGLVKPVVTLTTQFPTEPIKVTPPGAASESDPLPSPTVKVVVPSEKYNVGVASA